MKQFLELLRGREMLAQVTHEEELNEHLKEKQRVAYAGFDPTADSLHVGHFMPVMALRRWQQAGHKAVVLMGGGTAMVGDPTGKSEMRQMMTVDEIDRRSEKLIKQLGKFIDFSHGRAEVVNNAEWLRKLEYMSFLREFGSHFSVNRMLTAECFKQRLEKGLSFLEFNYMILQSYDFYHLHQKLGCTVQLGGDDQWSNMLGGMELIRRKARAQAFCVTVPLLVTSSGKKMGKTEKGAVWVDPDMTPPYDLFQYFRNVDDDMVEKCLFYFTDLPVEQVRELGRRQGADINESKVVLAWEITKLLHGEEEANKSKNAAAALFTKGAEARPAGAPEVLIERQSLDANINVIELMMAGQIFATKSEARRMIEQGGLTVNGQKVESIAFEVPKDWLDQPEGMLVRKGKKQYYNLKLTP